MPFFHVLDNSICLQVSNNFSSATNIVNNSLENVSSEQSLTQSSAVISHLPQDHASTSSHPTSGLNYQKVYELDESTINMLAFKFTEWFFSLLNKNFKGGLIALNSEHFWNDAEFILRLKSTSNFTRPGEKHLDNNIVIEEEHVVGIENIILLLNKIKDRYQIYFSPNLCSDGVKGKCDVHGGVLVLACGTLHKDIGQMCGAFEQVFLIFRDPLTVDNWKIKKSELHLISVDHNVTLTAPTINESTLKSCLM